jgi:tetratricopeptide (TPR) repeat protein
MSGELVELTRGGRLGCVLSRLARSGFTGLVYAERGDESVAITVRGGRPVFVEDLGDQQSIPDALLEQGLVSKEQYTAIATRVLELQSDNEDIAFCQVAVQTRVLTRAQVDAELERRTRGRLIQVVEWDGCRIELDDDPDSVTGLMEYPQDVGALIYMAVRTFFDEDRVRALIGPERQQYARLLRPIAEVLEFFELESDEAALLTHVQPDAPLGPTIEDKSIDALDGWQLVCMLVLAEMLEVQATPFAPAAERSGVRSRDEAAGRRDPTPGYRDQPSGSASQMRMPAVREEPPARGSQARMPAVREETGPTGRRAPLPREDDAGGAGGRAALREEYVRPASRPRMPVAREEPVTPGSRARMPVAREEPVTPGSRARMPAVHEEPAAPRSRPRMPTAREEPARPGSRQGVPAMREEPARPGSRQAMPAAREERAAPRAGTRAPSADQSAPVAPDTAARRASPSVQHMPAAPQVPETPAAPADQRTPSARPRRRPIRKLSTALQRLDRELKQGRRNPSAPQLPAQPAPAPAPDGGHARAHIEQLLRRRATAAMAQKPATGAAAVTTASDEFRLAQEALRDQQFGRAYEHLRKACDAEPNNEIYSMYCMWAAFRANTLQGDDVNKLRAALRARVSDDEHKAFAYYALGHISLAEKRDDLAEKFFRKAIEMNKNNKDAERHLRIIELRRKTAASEQRANKIFGIEIGKKS